MRNADTEPSVILSRTKKFQNMEIDIPKVPTPAKAELQLH